MDRSLYVYADMLMVAMLCVCRYFFKFYFCFYIILFVEIHIHWHAVLFAALSAHGFSLLDSLNFLLWTPPVAHFWTQRSAQHNNCQNANYNHFKITHTIIIIFRIRQDGVRAGPAKGLWFKYAQQMKTKPRPEKMSGGSQTFFYCFSTSFFLFFWLVVVECRCCELDMPQMKIKWLLNV